MSFLDPLGLFDSGSSSSASMSSSVTLDIKGLDKMGVTEKVTLDPIEIKPLSLTEKFTLDPLEIKPLTISENIDVKPLTISENIDLKPVAVDSCQTLRLAPLPETTVCNPYRHHISMTYFGIEVMAMDYDGESEQAIHSPHRPSRITERTTFPPRRDRTPQVLGEGAGIRVRLLDGDE